MIKSILLIIGVLILCPGQLFAAFTDATHLEIKNGDLAYLYSDYGVLSVIPDGEFVTLRDELDEFNFTEWIWKREEIDPGKQLIVGGPLLPQNEKSVEFLKGSPNAKIVAVSDNFKIKVKRFGHKVSTPPGSIQGTYLKDVYRSVIEYKNFKLKQKVRCFSSVEGGKISLIFSNGVAVVGSIFSKHLVALKDCYVSY